MTVEPTAFGPETEQALALEDRYLAPNYRPLSVAIARGHGASLYDELGKEYIDLVGAYSAVSQGHTHPRIYNALIEQANLVGATGRFVHNMLLGPFAAKLCQLVERQDPQKQMMMVPMNSGSEAVDTAMKISLRFATDVKEVKEGEARIIVARNNFHGRTYGALRLSDNPDYRRGFGPFEDNVDWVNYGDPEDLEDKITDKTAAYFVEPIQGEGGVIVPPQGYLRDVARICKDNNVLFVSDEIQTGLGRTGKWFASWHDDVQPDIFIVGKALGGGIYPVSAAVGRSDVIKLLNAGSHGSTWGGNPIACRVAIESLNVIGDEGLVERAAILGDVALERLKAIKSPRIKEVRGKGLLLGVELNEPARPYCEELVRQNPIGALSVPTHDNVVRFAPPLMIPEDDLHRALDLVEHVLTA